jgi:HK97 family phage major capsid protein
MSLAYLNSRIEERARLAAAIENTLDRCEREGRDPSPEERSQNSAWSDRIAGLDSEITELRTAIDANDRFERTVEHVSDAEERRERRAAVERERAVPEERQSYGERFVNSEAFRTYRGRGSSEAVEFEGFLERRAAIDTTVLGDVIPVYSWSGPTDPALRTPLLDVIGRERVSSGSVEYITWSDTAEAGGPIAEGAVKPEADFAPTTTPLSLDTYAHWKAITRQALEDYSRIRSIVEGKLRVGLAKKLESVAAGVINGATFETVTDPDALNGIRQGIGVVQANGYAPNALLVNPADYASLDIAASGAAGNGPTQFGNIWGLRPVPVPSVPEGTSFVGDFTEAVTWFDRNTTGVFMTDSHADYFVRNLLLVLAETRAAFAATNLEAAVKVVVGTPVAARRAAADSSK